MTLIDVDSPGVDLFKLESAQVALERDSAVEALSETTPDDIQAIASAQIRILDSYHKEVLLQAKHSFRIAFLASIAGLVFFLLAVGFTNDEKSKNYTTVPLLSGAIVEIVAGN